MTELYTEHLSVMGGITHKRFDQLEHYNRRPEYIETHVVPSGSQDHAYLVAKVEALEKDIERADIVEDKQTLYLCACDDFWFEQSREMDRLHEDSVSLSDIDTCKHIRAEYKTLKAQHDDKQDTLIP